MLLKRYNKTIEKICLEWDKFTNNIIKNRELIIEKIINLLVLKYSKDKNNNLSYYTILKVFASNNNSFNEIYFNSLKKNEKEMVKKFYNILCQILKVKTIDNNFYENMLNDYNLNNIEYNDQELENNKNKVYNFKLLNRFFNPSNY